MNTSHKSEYLLNFERLSKNLSRSIELLLKANDEFLTRYFMDVILSTKTTYGKIRIHISAAFSLSVGVSSKALRFVC